MHSKLIINKDIFDPEDTIVLWSNISITRSLEFGFRRPRELKCIQMFKEVFGCQLKTWLGGSENRRFYIWAFRLNNTVMYAMVHNVKGVVWEYPKTTRKEDLDNIHKEVYKRLTKHYVKG